MRSVLILAISILLLVIFGPLLAPYNPTAIDIPNRLAPPSGEFWIWHRPLWAGFVLPPAPWCALVAGACPLDFHHRDVARYSDWADSGLGRQGRGLAGHARHRCVSVFSDLVAAIVIAGLMGAGVWSLIFALTVTGWMRYARVARAVSLSIKSRGYVIPGPPSRPLLAIARWHYLPALLPSITVVGPPPSRAQSWASPRSVS